MKSGAFLKSVVAGVACFMLFQPVQASVGVDTILKFPRAEFSNNSPSAGEKITVRWWIGLHNDACVPGFETSVTTKISNDVVYYYLKYKEIPVDRANMVCAQVLTPYGPKFEIGPFMTGDYTYKIYVDTLLVREFHISSTGYPYPVITPKEPRDGDNVSIQWVLGQDSVNCVMQYAGSVISSSLLKSNPPIHVINVKYKEAPVEYVACLPRPTLYGPTFEIGKVETGEYVIYNDSSVVAKFTVAPKGEVQPVMTVYPEQPYEGDSLKVKIILGRGSSSCAPSYIPKFERVSSAGGIYEYALTYETIENTRDSVCTKDYVPFGPEWLFTDLKTGIYVFRYSENNYYKVFVQKKRQIPDFPYVTIKGTVFEVNKGVETLRAVTVPQCTVMVVFDNIVVAKKPQYYIDSIANGEDTAAGITVSTESSRDMFMAVTNEKGEYTISNVPSSVLLNRSYTVAVKNSFVGYGTIPDSLTKEVVSDITLYTLEAFVDSVKAMLGGSEDVVSLVRQLGLEKASGVKESRIRTAAKATLIATSGGFELINPSEQKMNVATFSLNGKRIWSQNFSQLSEGRHFFAVPRTGTGLVIVKIQGEQFTQSSVISVTQR